MTIEATNALAAYAINVAVTTFLSYGSSDSDALLINHHKDLDHHDPLRYIAGVSICVITCLISGTLWSLTHLGICWAVFTISFRLMLNAKREPRKPWWYVSRSNGYDRIWLNATGSTDRNVHRTARPDNVPLAGKTAYTFESIVLIGLSWLYMYKAVLHTELSEAVLP